MDAKTRRPAVTWTLAGRLTVVLLLGFISSAQAQGPQVDVEEPPGASASRGSLGPAIGASGTSAFDVSPVTTQESMFGGRAGPSVSRVPLNQVGAPPPSLVQQGVRFKPRVLEPAPVPPYGELEETGKPESAGPAGGLTLDGAIQRLLVRNLNLIALRFEIPMAEADALTASLRSNPIFYADSQLVPYGHYSNQRPGGQTQYDVNITYPIDVWRKRRARIHAAEAAKRVTEAQFQDAIRLQIDNLYTAYVDVVAARETERYSEQYVIGIQRLRDATQQLLKGGFVKPSDVDAAVAQLEQAQLQLREASQAYKKSTRTLGLLLDMPRGETDVLQVNAMLRDVRPLPLPEPELVRMGQELRPDLASYRLGVHRAKADVKLAYANRFSDVYLLYQPYTLQNNSPLGLKSAYSYAFGATVSVPIYNWNQGNIQRSRLNVTQTEFELANLQRQVEYDVEEAVREFDLSRNSVIEYEKEVVPASRRVRNTAFSRYKGGETNILDYLDAQKDYNEVVRRFRDALVRHRRAMLDLNTAVGTRVLP